MEKQIDSRDCIARLVKIRDLLKYQESVPIGGSPEEIYHLSREVLGQLRELNIRALEAFRRTCDHEYVDYIKGDGEVKYCPKCGALGVMTMTDECSHKDLVFFARKMFCVACGAEIDYNGIEVPRPDRDTQYRVLDAGQRPTVTEQVDTKCSHKTRIVTPNKTVCFHCDAEFDKDGKPFPSKKLLIASEFCIRIEDYNSEDPDAVKNDE